MPDGGRLWAGKDHPYPPHERRAVLAIAWAYGVALAADMKFLGGPQPPTPPRRLWSADCATPQSRCATLVLRR